jgi:pantoate--beta-alanine ligase
MQVVESVEELKHLLYQKNKAGQSVGFVPTMGALHEGHLSLIRASRKDNNITVCSIFVNPLQFNNSNDLTTYPRTPESDIEMLSKAGCDILFTPVAGSMYPEAPRMSISFGALEKVMEGQHRPGHFNGVAIVVAKLFHLVKPTRAYFGQKDLQQFLIINRLVKDLSFDLQLVCCDIIREEDGLAMSSRNRRLSPEHRAIAPKLYEALQLAQTHLTDEEPEQVKLLVEKFLEDYPLIKLEYIEVADAQSLEPLINLREQKQAAVCIAAWLGDVRLIDNVLVEARA